MKFRKNDHIIVTIGKDKGKKGSIEALDPKKMTALVPGVNVYKRHKKRRDEKHPGGIIEFARPLSFGKIALICPKCGKQTRIGFSGTGKEKDRVCKKCAQKI